MDFMQMENRYIPRCFPFLSHSHLARAADSTSDHIDYCQSLRGERRKRPSLRQAPGTERRRAAGRDPRGLSPVRRGGQGGPFRARRRARVAGKWDEGVSAGGKGNEVKSRLTAW